MCTVLLPPGDNPIAANKYIISYISYHIHTADPFKRELRQCVRTVTRLRGGRPGFETRQGNVFPFPKTSRPDLWLTQPIQWAPAFFPGVRAAEELI